MPAIWSIICLPYVYHLVYHLSTYMLTLSMVYSKRAAI